MVIRARRWNVIAAAVGIAGMLLLSIWTEPPLAGVLTGATLSGVACLAFVYRRLSQLAKREVELAATQARYDAAFAALAGQRERLRSALEAELSDRLAAMEAQHRGACVRAKADGYVEGALAALGGRLPGTPMGAEAEIISLAARRPHPQGGADSPN